jgi:2-dehydro-3-deoxyphosphooctonate aldolase (KDO 8-P synthase)
VGTPAVHYVKNSIMTPFTIGEDLTHSFTITPDKLFFIAGPCVIESRDHILRHAEFLKKTFSNIFPSNTFQFIFKSSFDKANRTSNKSFRGVGREEGLKILEEVRSEFQVPVLTDIHTEEDAKVCAEVIDVLQIPAFLCRQTDLLIAAGEAAQKKNRAVHIKKGQFLHPADMQFVAEKISEAGCKRILLCERGASFGYRELVVDFRSLPIMQETGFPVVFDATHSVQIIGGLGGKSGGARQYVAPLARAAVAVGVNGIFFECHENPDQAPSDGPNMLPLEDVSHFLISIKKIHEAQSA